MKTRSRAKGKGYSPVGRPRVTRGAFQAPQVYTLPLVRREALALVALVDACDGLRGVDHVVDDRDMEMCKALVERIMKMLDGEDVEAV